MKIDLTDKHFTEKEVIEYIDSHLAPTAHLEELNLTGNKVEKLSFLGKYSTLNSLNLSDTLVEDISELQQLQNLRKLLLSGTSVLDISSLRFCPHLRSIDLTGTQVQDISVLPQLTELETLSLSSTLVNNKCIDYLLQLRNLKNLYLNNVDISEEVLLKLKGLTSLETIEVDDDAVKRQLNISFTTNKGKREKEEKPIVKLSEFSVFVTALSRGEDLQTAAQYLSLEAQKVVNSICGTSCDSRRTP